MKRFEFRLERARDWRRSQLEIELGAAAALAGELARIGEERRSVEAERRAAERSVLAAPAVPASQFAALDAFRRFSDAAAAALDRRRADCEQRLAGQRRRVLEARQRYELLNRLQARALAAWRAAFEREQENLAGELYLARLARRRRE